MLVRGYMLAAIVSLGCISAHAQSAGGNPEATTTLPGPVATALKSLADLCRDSGGTPVTDQAVTRIDLTGDGKEDYLLNVAGVNCQGAASVYGDREKGVTVYLGDGGGGASEAFNDVVFGAKVEGTGPAAKLWVTVAGPRCGTKPAADFASERFCERALTWNAKTRKFDYAPVSTVRMIE
jgi:hypothetical protein